MALRIVRVNGTPRPPKLPVINFMYPTGHYEGCARLGTNCAIKNFCLAKGPLIRMARVENALRAFHLSAQPNFKGFSLL